MIVSIFGAICSRLRVREDGEIAAGDVESDSAQRNFILVATTPPIGCA